MFIAVWAPFAPSPAFAPFAAAVAVGRAVVIGTSLVVVVATIDDDVDKVVFVSPDVDNVVAVDAVEISVLELVVAAVVSRGVSVKETGITSIVSAAESVVLVVFLNGAACRNSLSTISLVLTG